VPFRHDFVGNRGESARHERVSVAGRAAAARGVRIPPPLIALRVAVRIKAISAIPRAGRHDFVGNRGESARYERVSVDSHDSTMCAGRYTFVL
jgi:hypothetical protein